METIKIIYDHSGIKLPLLPKGMKELKQLSNGMVEDSYGRKYWYDENGSIRRLK